VQTWYFFDRALTMLARARDATRLAFCARAYLLGMVATTQAEEARQSGPINMGRREQQGIESLDTGAIRKIVAEKLQRGLDAVPSIVVSIMAFGARGDGVSDDTAAMERAVRSLRKGGIVVFPPGTYIQSRSIRIESPNIIFWGSGGTLHGSNPMNQALGLIGDGSALIGLKLTARFNVRATDLPQTRIVLAGKGNTVVENAVDGASAAGIMVYGGSDFRIEGNTVRNTLADGIHMTNGAHGGIVVRNVVRGSHDDMIAVVSYGKVAPVRDILIVNNDVAGNPWGRGIAIVGGRDITIRDNRIRDVRSGAGVLVAREGVWNTNGSSNIVIERNVLEQIQTQGEVLAGRPRTGQGAIEIYSDGKGDRDLAVHTILISDNEIRDASADAVRILGSVCNVEFVDNHFYGIGGAVLKATDVSCQEAKVSCRGNRHEGAPISGRICDSFASGALGATVRE
jgi:parallel beta-helix repeat protein